jgi:1,4-alpha-glucan branching enzyme
MLRRQPNTPLKLHYDSWLKPFLPKLNERSARVKAIESKLTGDKQSLADYSSGHEYFGLHFRDGEWIFREWAPNATEIFLIGDFSAWHEIPQFSLTQIDKNGVWEIKLPAKSLNHGMLYRLNIHWRNGSGSRIPAYARRVVQDTTTNIFNAQVWLPEHPYLWRNPNPVPKIYEPLIYEAHIGMSREFAGVSSYRQFKDEIVPRIATAGYNTIQLMAIMEHPYYGSFGYHVSNFFAASSRFGTPEEFKELVDVAHAHGLRVIIDIVHSHAVRNESEGLGKFDGTRYQYFHDGARGEHSAWDSYCFNYAKPEVLHFLLSNCRFWLDEYHLDGFRFDGITSMLYLHHGLGHAFTTYADYFGNQIDEDAVVYLTLANKVIHEVNPAALTIAEDVSGMPGLAAPIEHCGCGFDYRLAMGVTDYWFKLFDTKDENWSMSGLWHELNNRRKDEKTISYVECHDQSIVGGQTVIFRLAGADMYHAMRIDMNNYKIERAVAIHKMVRLITLASAGNGYLNFIGNEFGHPEWVDFPRQGNDWSYHYARRQWSLKDNKELRYGQLGNFDRAILIMASANNLIGGGVTQIIALNEDKKIIFFERSGLFFFFNFHQENSYVDYPCEVLPGEYTLELDSDAIEFGGHARITPGQHYFTNIEKIGKNIHNRLKIYLPSRTVIVLKKIF